MENIINKQKEFQTQLGFNFEEMTQKEVSEYLKENGYFLIEEITELLREIKFHKSWKSYDNWTDKDDLESIIRAREEWSDVFHFLINIGLALGIDTKKDVEELYYCKQDTNRDRQKNNY